MKVLLKLSVNRWCEEMVLSLGMPYLMSYPLKRNLSTFFEWKTPFTDFNWVLPQCGLRQFL